MAASTARLRRFHVIDYDPNTRLVYYPTYLIDGRAGTRLSNPGGYPSKRARDGRLSSTQHTIQ